MVLPPARVAVLVRAPTGCFTGTFHWRPLLAPFTGTPRGAGLMFLFLPTRIRLSASWGGKNQAVSFHDDGQPHGRMDCAEGLECTRTWEADRHRLSGLLRSGVVVEARVVDAHVVGARVVVEHGQQLAGPHANVWWAKELVGLAYKRCVGGRSPRRRHGCVHPRLARGLRRRLARQRLKERYEI